VDPLRQWWTALTRVMAIRSLRWLTIAEYGFCCLCVVMWARCCRILVASGASIPSVDARNHGWKDSRRVSQMAWYFCLFCFSCSRSALSGSWDLYEMLSRLAILTSI
jgi:hypothetical protein